MRFEQLQTMNQKWLTLSKRERWMVFGAGLFAVAGLMDTFLLEPQRTQLAETQQEIATIQSDTVKLTEQMTTIASQASPQPGSNVFMREIEETNQKIASQSADLVKVSSYMVPPQEMVALLKKLLQEQADVQVVAMESLPVVDFVEKQRKQLQAQSGDGANSTAQSGSDEVWKGVPHIYQHAVSMRLKGKYFALMAYAQSLKDIGRNLAWEHAELKADYPESELTVQVYTLSGENAWLGI